MLSINRYLEVLSLAGLRTLFRQNPWAPQRLAGFRGKTFCFRLEHTPQVLPRQWSMRIARDGYFEAWPAEQHDLSLSLAFEAKLLMQISERGVQAVLPHLKLEGDVLLAAALGEVFRDLEWDLVGVIAPYIGPAIAHRLDLQLARSAASLKQWMGRSDWVAAGSSTAWRETRPGPSA